MTDLFREIKENVTARQAAERYGLRVSAHGMACCPFHSDRTPSMKVDRRYYCFGCGETGDAVDLAAYLLHLAPGEAALRIAEDFGLNIRREPRRTKKREEPAPPPRADPQEEAAEWMARAEAVLIEYRRLLRDFEESDAPEDPDDTELHPLFDLALREKDYIDYLLDELELCTKDRFPQMKKYFGKEVDTIDEKLGRADPGRKEGNGGPADGRRECPAA